MTEKEKKKPGLFGRMFGGGDKATNPEPPTEVRDKPASEDSVPAAEAARQVEQVQEKEQAPEKEQAGEVEKVSWFKRLTGGLSKTSSKLTEGITGVFTKRKLDDEAIQDLEDLLVQADLGVPTAMKITDALAATRYNKDITSEEVRNVLAEEVAKLLEPVAVPLEVNSKNRPHVLLMVGVNGTGKTTTIGKLAKQFAGEGRSVMLAAGDTFRAAAIDQLKVWGDRTGATVVAGEVGADAAGLAFDALTQAKEEGTDVLMIDTAGRLQNKTDLMDELAKIVRVLRKIDPDVPHDVILSLDATTGQNALSQVKAFQEIASVSGLVMTKLDGTARGGILVAIAEAFKLPIHAIGVGEGIDDLQPFEPIEFANALAQVNLAEAGTA